MGRLSPVLIDEIEAVCRQISDAATPAAEKETLYRRLQEIYDAYFVLVEETKANVVLPLSSRQR